MFKKASKIKIYTHHNKFLSANVSMTKLKKGLWSKFLSFVFHIFYFAGFIVLSIFNFFKNTIFKTSYNVGNLIIKTILYTFNSIKKDILQTKQNIPQRFNLLLRKNFIVSILTFVVVIAIGAGLLSSLKLVAKALDIKNKISKTAFFGNIYLNKAKDSLVEQNFNGAENNFLLAYKTFKQGEVDINESGQALNNILSIIPQKKDADRLLKAAGLISQAGSSFISLEQSLQNIKLTSAGIISLDGDISSILNNVNLSLQDSKNKISEANVLVNEVNESNLPDQYKENFLDLKSKLNIASQAVNNFKSIFDIALGIIGGDKKILLLFENNNELRATGGFMGTFGLLALKNGAITSINVSSIYDLDGQLKEIIKPPLPMLNVNDRWFLRDSNWFANFPESARKISNFYEKEGGETPDIIMAITPNIIVDWLKITGPIELPKYNLTLDANNFVESTQVATTLSNELPTNSPKQILADLVPILLQKISELEPESYANIIFSIQNNLNNKQIAIYSRDQDLQQKMEDFNWTGSFKNTDRDFLSVVSSNLGGTKTDLSIDQQITLKTNINFDRTITNELTITRTNKLPKLEKTFNLSFIRAYIPLGSKIVSSIGFDYKNLEYPPDLEYKIDDAVQDWQKSAVKDLLTGSIIGKESGKTFVGNWLKLEGGESKTIKIVYTLPFEIDNIDRYSLMLQKQMGSNDQKFNWQFNFSGYNIAWKNFDPDILNTSDLNSDIILDKDYFQGLVLEKR